MGPDDGYKWNQKGPLYMAWNTWLTGGYFTSMELWARTYNCFIGPLCTAWFLFSVPVNILGSMLQDLIVIILFQDYNLLYMHASVFQWCGEIVLYYWMHMFCICLITIDLFSLSNLLVFVSVGSNPALKKQQLFSEDAWATNLIKPEVCGRSNGCHWLATWS